MEGGDSKICKEGSRNYYSNAPQLLLPPPPPPLKIIRIITHGENGNFVVHDFITRRNGNCSSSLEMLINFLILSSSSSGIFRGGRGRFPSSKIPRIINRIREIRRSLILENEKIIYLKLIIFFFIFENERKLLYLECM